MPLNKEPKPNQFLVVCHNLGKFSKQQYGKCTENKAFNLYRNNKDRLPVRVKQIFYRLFVLDRM